MAETIVGSAGLQDPARNRPIPHVPFAAWLVPCCYLAAALVLTWRLWADPASRAQVVAANGISHDVDLFAWFVWYAATAVAHGHLPALVTTTLNAPRGINLMWNTSLLLPGVVLAPVTLLAGPQVSLTVLLVLAFAGSAASLFVVLRRWGASISAAALGGALYGFSPALRMEAGGHYQLVFVVLPPLIVDALLRIVTCRGHAVRGGIWLGLLVAAQVFTSEEILVQTVVAAVIIVAVLAASQPQIVPGRIKQAVTGVGSAAVMALLVCGYPLWMQFHGPLAEHGSPWKVTDFKNRLANFVTPPGGVLFHSRVFANALARHPVAAGEYVAYLGWPLLAVLLTATVCFWRDRRVRVAAVTFWLLEIFSLGGVAIKAGGLHYPAALLPWYYLQHLPLLSQMLPNRFSLLADGAAAAVLALSLDLTRAAVRTDWQRRVAAAGAILAVLPVLPLPFQAARIEPVPAGWTAAFTRLRLTQADDVLVVPSNQAMMRWQADTNVPGSLVGGRCIVPSPAGKAESCREAETATSTYLTDLWKGRKGLRAPSRTEVRANLAHMRLTAIVVVTRRGSRLDHASIRLFGPPTFQIGTVLAWRTG